jgi:hypothetical protein
MKITKINIPIYFGYLRIIIAKDFAKAANKIKYETPLDLSLFGAFVYAEHTKKKKYTLYTCFFKPDATHSSIAHEVVHLVNSIYHDRGMKLDVLEDEPQAYLTGWVTEQIYKTIKKK